MKQVISIQPHYSIKIAASILTAVVLLTSCKKQVANPKSGITQVANSSNVSSMIAIKPNPIVTQDDSTVAARKATTISPTTSTGHN